MQTTLNVVTELDDEDIEGKARYTFSLHAVHPDGGTQVTRTFVVDVPMLESGQTDVWVWGATVEVGDTPADGFATFSPTR